MKKLIIFLAVFLFAQDLNIESKNFIYDNKKNISIFTKNVKVIKGEDKIFCDKMIVHFDKHKKVKFVDAIGNVKFKIVQDKNSVYTGEAKELKYYVKKGDIILIKGYIKKEKTDEILKGDLIKMNKFTKNIDVKGSKNPVKIKLKVE